MSIKLGTDFDLKSKQFLDSRQGLPKTKADLKEWSTPVPPGFEVCLEEVWYYYDPTFEGAENNETGYWIPRLVGKSELLEGDEIINGENRGVTADAVGQVVEEINTSVWSAIHGIEDRLNASADAEAGYKISNIVWGINIPNGSDFEVGTTVNILKNGIPTISYKITGTGYSDNTVYTFTEGLSETYRRDQKETITKEITHAGFITQTGNSMDLFANATLNWTYYRFWGSVNEEDRGKLLGGGTQGYEVLRSLNKELSTSSSIETSFDCSSEDYSGKYPVFAFCGSSDRWPKRVTVGGLDNSNYTTYTKSITNNYGINIFYNIFMLDQIQTGDNIVINIKG